MAESKSAALPLGDAPNRDAVNRSAAPRRKAQLPARAERLLSSGCDSPRPDRARSGADPLTAPALSLLALIVAALLIVGAGAAVLPRRRVLFTTATAALSGLGILASLIGLLGGAARASLAIPLGLPGGTILLALDPLSGFFLLLLFVTATACAVFALEPHGAEEPRSPPFFPVFIAAMALTLLAGDAYALVFGFELMSLASWAMVLARHEEAGLARRGAALSRHGGVRRGVPGPGLRRCSPRRRPRASTCASPRCAPHRPRAGAPTAVLVLVPARRGLEGRAGAAACLAAARASRRTEPRLGADVGGDDQGRRSMWSSGCCWTSAGRCSRCGGACRCWSMGAASAVLGALRAKLEPDLRRCWRLEHHRECRLHRDRHRPRAGRAGGRPARAGGAGARRRRCCTR